ncbi:MAG: ribonuclease E/G [Lachnospiraceae bacterium]|nr:ribonuclease E/G [Lachnospiraceae bacterium]
MKKIIVTAYKKMLFSALAENEKIIEMDADPEPGSLKAGDIVLATVRNTADNIKAAFCEIGSGMIGFLPFTECNVPLKGHMLIPVQIKRDASGLKERMLSARFSVPGRNLVLLYEPAGEHFCVSKKVSDKARTAELKELLAGKCTDTPFGFIIRTNAFSADIETILSEADALLEQGASVLNAAEHRTPGSILYRAPDLCREWLLGAAAEEEIEVISEKADYLDVLKKDPLLSGIPFSARHYTDPFPLEKLFRLDHYTELALSRKVWLRSGGFLIIDRTEAMTVIDVNTGSAVSGKDKEETFLKINLEAAEEIAYQLRLRNLSGIIIVDLINMKSRDHMKAVEACFHKALSGDPHKAVLMDITRLGLAEITRQKKRKPFYAAVLIS